jgi:hypothetical protein
VGARQALAQLAFADLSGDRRVAGERHYNIARRIPDGHTHQPSAPDFQHFNVPDRVKGEPLLVENNRGPDSFFNPAAFRVPGTTLSKSGAAIQLFGDSARRVARGPGSVNFDFSLFKEVAIKERVRVQFRSEAFNLTNTPTFSLPSSNSPSMTCIGRTPGSACNDNNPEFGKLSGSSATGRQLQFGMKVIF